MGKMISVFVYIVTVVSFGRYDFERLLPFVFFPVILMALSETPYLMLFKRVLITLPFCLFVGISNLFLERETAFVIGNIAVSYGAVSLGVILFRACLCVTAALLLVALTPFTELTAQLRRLKLPEIFVMLFEMTYRYIAVLFSEDSNKQTAYTQPGGGVKGVDIREAGTFIGSLLVRSFDRAERIYSAMKCRGYPARNGVCRKSCFRFSDAVYCALVCGLCLTFRIIDAGSLYAILAAGIK
jgi:cobalt/nickel transport system permease protein